MHRERKFNHKLKFGGSQSAIIGGGVMQLNNRNVGNKVSTIQRRVRRRVPYLVIDASKALIGIDRSWFGESMMEGKHENSIG